MSKEDKPQIKSPTPSDSTKLEVQKFILYSPKPAILVPKSKSILSPNSIQSPSYNIQLINSNLPLSPTSSNSNSFSTCTASNTSTGTVQSKSSGSDVSGKRRSRSLRGRKNSYLSKLDDFKNKKNKQRELKNQTESKTEQVVETTIHDKKFVQLTISDEPIQTSSKAEDNKLVLKNRKRKNSTTNVEKTIDNHSKKRRGSKSEKVVESEKAVDTKIDTTSESNSAQNSNVKNKQVKNQTIKTNKKQTKSRSVSKDDPKIDKQKSKKTKSKISLSSYSELKRTPKVDKNTKTNHMLEGNKSEKIVLQKRSSSGERKSRKVKNRKKAEWELVSLPLSDNENVVKKKCKITKHKKPEQNIKKRKLSATDEKVNNDLENKNLQNLYKSESFIKKDILTKHEKIKEDYKIHAVQLPKFSKRIKCHNYFHTISDSNWICQHIIFDNIGQPSDIEIPVKEIFQFTNPITKTITKPMNFIDAELFLLQQDLKFPLPKKALVKYVIKHQFDPCEQDFKYSFRYNMDLIKQKDGKFYRHKQLLQRTDGYSNEKFLFGRELSFFDQSVYSKILNYWQKMSIGEVKEIFRKAALDKNEFDKRMYHLKTIELNKEKLNKEKIEKKKLQKQISKEPPKITKANPKPTTPQQIDLNTALNLVKLLNPEKESKNEKIVEKEVINLVNDDSTTTSHDEKDSNQNFVNVNKEKLNIEDKTKLSKTQFKELLKKSKEDEYVGSPSSSPYYSDKSSEDDLKRVNKQQNQNSTPTKSNNQTENIEKLRKFSSEKSPNDRVSSRMSNYSSKSSHSYNSHKQHYDSKSSDQSQKTLKSKSPHPIDKRRLDKIRPIKYESNTRRQPDSKSPRQTVYKNNPSPKARSPSRKRASNYRITPPPRRRYEDDRRIDDRRPVDDFYKREYLGPKLSPRSNSSSNLSSPNKYLDRIDRRERDLGSRPKSRLKSPIRDRNDRRLSPRRRLESDIVDRRRDNVRTHSKDYDRFRDEKIRNDRRDSTSRAIDRKMMAQRAREREIDDKIRKRRLNSPNVWSPRRTPPRQYSNNSRNSFNSSPQSSNSGKSLRQSTLSPKGRSPLRDRPRINHTRSPRRTSLTSSKKRQNPDSTESSSMEEIWAKRSIKSSRKNDLLKDINELATKLSRTSRAKSRARSKSKGRKSYTGKDINIELPESFIGPKIKIEGKINQNSRDYGYNSRPFDDIKKRK